VLSLSPHPTRRKPFQKKKTRRKRLQITLLFVFLRYTPLLGLFHRRASNFSEKIEVGLDVLITAFCE
jgi:hypothetical protein